ncbi:MAG: serine O-acetyltransferase EpsC [Synergistes sp.]|nr:serine O-acetyltransferase EpsC [Synergistes sp.]
MGVWKYIKSDYDAAKRNDPAIPDGIRGFFEVLFCTPGFLAITAHRGIHFLHSTLHIPLLPRFISLFVRWWTGIEIHPAAQIGYGFFIDHGAGVVIGETTIVGNNVTMYQGVTLGGTGNEKCHKRHPTIGDNVFIGSGAKLLGPITVGANARIGANSAVLKDVPEYATVTGMRARIIKVDGQPVSSGESEYSPEELFKRIIRLEEEVYYLRGELKKARGGTDDAQSDEKIAENITVEIEYKKGKPF